MPLTTESQAALNQIVENTRPSSTQLSGFLSSNNPQCVTCIYAHLKFERLECRRYPVFQARQKTDWCGEYEPEDDTE